MMTATEIRPNAKVLAYVHALDGNAYDYAIAYMDFTYEGGRCPELVGSGLDEQTAMGIRYQIRVLSGVR